MVVQWICKLSGSENILVHKTVNKSHKDYIVFDHKNKWLCEFNKYFSRILRILSFRLSFNIISSLFRKKNHRENSTKKTNPEIFLHFIQLTTYLQLSCTIYYENAWCPITVIYITWVWNWNMESICKFYIVVDTDWFQL